MNNSFNEKKNLNDDINQHETTVKSEDQTSLLAQLKVLQLEIEKGNVKLIRRH